MKNSVCTAGLSHSGVPTVLLISRPSPSAKMTYSMPQSTNSPLPARKRASQREREDRPASPSRNGATRAADQRDADRADDQEADADSSDLQQIGRA